MRLAWFRAATHLSERLDDTAALVAALGSGHEILVVDEARAHDFIRLHFRSPFDLCVYELADAPRHAFIWPYLLHVPGVLRLRSLSLHDSRSQSLRRQLRERDRAAELAFGDWDLTSAPILASRMTVVADAHAAAHLQRAHPGVHVRCAPLGLPAQGETPLRTLAPSHPRTLAPSPPRPLAPVIGSLDASRAGVVERACARARDAGASLELITDASPDQILDHADILVATTWPPADEATLAIAGMAAARAVIVLETEHTAGWPALDPQTWQPRGWTGTPPVVVSIDPRDEEHSLSLALRRLAADAALRHGLGTAAHDWWRQHATLDHAVHAWRAILAEAATLTPPPRPSHWPRHLTADGTERAREILGEFATTVDFLS